jgi:hypothetical protein
MEIESTLFFLQFSIMEKAPDKLPKWNILKDRMATKEGGSE